MNFSKNIVLALEKSDWSPQRKIDATEVVKGLTDEGYQLNKYALEVIEQFGYLELEQPSFKIKNQTEKLHFDPLKACDHIFRERVEEYELKIGESLVVIGSAYNEYLTLMISNNGNVYGGYDDYLTLLGNSFEEALEAIFHPKETEEIK